MPLAAAAEEAATLHSLMGSAVSVAGDERLPLTLIAKAAALRTAVRIIVHLRRLEATVARSVAEVRKSDCSRSKNRTSIHNHRDVRIVYG